MSLSVDGLRRKKECGASHRGRKRSDEARERMRKAAIANGSADRLWVPVPKTITDEAVRRFLRGATQREAAKAAGCTLGALQRALARLGA